MPDWRFAAPALEITGYHAADLLPWLKHTLAMRLAFLTRRASGACAGANYLDEYDGRHKPPLRVRLRLTGFWDLPPGMLK